MLHAKLNISSHTLSLVGRTCIRRNYAGAAFLEFNLLWSQIRGTFRRSIYGKISSLQSSCIFFEGRAFQLFVLFLLRQQQSTLRSLSSYDVLYFVRASAENIVATTLFDIIFKVSCYCYDKYCMCYILCMEKVIEMQSLFFHYS